MPSPNTVTALNWMQLSSHSSMSSLVRFGFVLDEMVKLTEEMLHSIAQRFYIRRAWYWINEDERAPILEE